MKKILFFCFPSLFFFIVLFFPPYFISAEAKKKPSSDFSSTSKTVKTLPEIKRIEKSYQMKVNGKLIRYSLVFDCIPVKTDSLPHYSGRMCYNAYLISDKKTEADERPITFFFNGGPGAASVYLNFGVAGPWIIQPRINADNFILPDGARLTENSRSWLDRSDLVFVDPVGTGFSYVVPDQVEEEKKILKQFWGVHEDLQSLSHFIRLWVTDNNRWLSPKVLVGESYGGLRVGSLASYLLNKTGISPAGIVMVSPALDLWLIRENSSISLSPWLRLLPSFIHTAQYYQLGDISPLPSEGDLEERIETYLLEKYLPQIAQGNTLNYEERKSFYNDLSRLIGLEERIIARKRGLISLADYSKNLLQKEGKVLSLYDTLSAYPDPNPKKWYYGQDTFLTTLSAAFQTVAHHYYRDILEFNDLREFHILNARVNASWNYPGDSTSVETFTDLEKGINANPQMVTLIVHGRHDLVTPYYSSRYLINHSSIPQAKEKIRLRLYDGGHMFYLHPQSLKEFDEDVHDFYEQVMKVYRSK